MDPIRQAHPHLPPSSPISPLCVAACAMTASGKRSHADTNRLRFLHRLRITACASHLLRLGFFSLHWLHGWLFTHRHRHRHTDTQAHRHTGTQTHRHTDTQTHTQTHRHTDAQTPSHTLTLSLCDAPSVSAALRQQTLHYACAHHRRCVADLSLQLSAEDWAAARVNEVRVSAHV